MTSHWKLKLEAWQQDFAHWRAGVWMRKAKRALERHDWWAALAKKIVR